MPTARRRPGGRLEEICILFNYRRDVVSIPASAEQLARRRDIAGDADVVAAAARTDIE
jgi:hypothetical protein